MRVTKHLMSKRKGKTQLGDYSVLQQEGALEINLLEIVLRQQGKLKALLKQRKAKTLENDRGRREQREDW